MQRGGTFDIFIVHRDYQNRVVHFSNVNFQPLIPSGRETGYSNYLCSRRKYSLAFSIVLNYYSTRILRLSHSASGSLSAFAGECNLPFSSLFSCSYVQRYQRHSVKSSKLFLHGPAGKAVDSIQDGRRPGQAHQNVPLPHPLKGSPPMSSIRLRRRRGPKLRNCSHSIIHSLSRPPAKLHQISPRDIHPPNLNPRLRGCNYPPRLIHSRTNSMGSPPSQNLVN